MSATLSHMDIVNECVLIFCLIATRSIYLSLFFKEIHNNHILYSLLCGLRMYALSCEQEAFCWRTNIS